MSETYGSKGSGVANIDQNLHFPCGYPNHAGWSIAAASEFPWMTEATDGSSITPLLKAKVGCYVCVRFGATVAGDDLGVEFLNGTGTLVQGSIGASPGGDITLVYQIDSVSSDRDRVVSLRCTHATAVVTCGEYYDNAVDAMDGGLERSFDNPGWPSSTNPMASGCMVAYYTMNDANPNSDMFVEITSGDVGDWHWYESDGEGGYNLLESMGELNPVLHFPDSTYPNNEYYLVIVSGTDDNTVELFFTNTDPENVCAPFYADPETAASNTSDLIEPDAGFSYTETETFASNTCWKGLEIDTYKMGMGEQISLLSNADPFDFVLYENDEGLVILDSGSVDSGTEVFLDQNGSILLLAYTPSEQHTSVDFDVAVPVVILDQRVSFTVVDNNGESGNFQSASDSVPLDAVNFQAFGGTTQTSRNLSISHYEGVDGFIFNLIAIEIYDGSTWLPVSLTNNFELRNEESGVLSFPEDRLVVELDPSFGGVDLRVSDGAFPVFPDVNDGTSMMRMNYEIIAGSGGGGEG